MKLKKKLALNYLVATLLALVFVGLAVIRGLQKLSITTMEQQPNRPKQISRNIYFTDSFSRGSGGSNKFKL